MKVLYRSIFWLSVMILLTGLFYLSYGRNSAIYFKNQHHSQWLQDFLTGACPVAVIGLLFGALRRQDQVRKKVIRIGAAVFFAILIPFSVASVRLVSEPVEWYDLYVVFRAKSDQDWTITMQRQFEGPWNVSGVRTVEKKSINTLFEKIEVIDTTLINKAAWDRIPTINVSANPDLSK